MPSTLLIVDDSPDLHKIARAYLADDTIKIHSVEDGVTALAAAAELRPDLILLDVDMPRLDGFEVCRRLKNAPATSAVPVIFVTANAALMDKVKGLDLGAVDYITKPFKPEELQARVKAALRARQLLERAALVDGLTGLWNRAYLNLHLPAQLSLARRSNRPLTCIVANIDSLGGLNGLHGRAFGDEVIRATGHILLSQCRTEDTVCHDDGGRFVSLVPGVKQAMAAHLADRSRAEIERQLHCYRGIEASVTCSFGIADSEHALGANLIDRADAALYRAKQLGRGSIWVNPTLTPRREVA